MRDDPEAPRPAMRLAQSASPPGSAHADAVHRDGGEPSRAPRVGRETARGTVVMTGVLWLLRVVTAGALAVDVYVHADLASDYDFTNASVSQGALFRVEAGAAALAALLLIAAGRRPLVWVFAFLVAAAGLAAVMVYRYVDVGAFGPFPDMYEPLWYAEKTRSAIAEAIGTVTALAGFLLAYRLAAPHRRRARNGADADTP